MKKIFTLLTVLSVMAPCVWAQPAPMPEPKAKYELQSAVTARQDSTVYFYDANHRPMREDHWAFGNDQAWQFSWSDGVDYNDAGYLTCQWSGTYRTEYDYDADGRVLEFRRYERPDINSDFVLMNHVTHVYNSDGYETETRNYMGYRASDGSLVKAQLAQAVSMEYNDRPGLVTCRTELRYNPWNPEAGITSGNRFTFTYGEEHDNALTQSVENYYDQQWIPIGTTQFTYAKYPFNSGLDNPYYRTSETSEGSNVSSLFTIEGDSVFYHSVTNNTNQLIVEDNKYVTVPVTDRPGVVTLRDISQLRTLNESDSYKSTYCVTWKYDGNGHIVEEYTLNTYESNGDVQSSGSRIEYERNGAGLPEKISRYIINSNLGDPFVSDITEYEYTGNTNQICHLVQKSCYSPNEELVTRLDMAMTFDLDYPQGDFNFYGSDYNEIPLYYMPLTKVDNLSGTKTVYHYNITPLGSIDGIDTDKNAYGVWPSMVDDMILVTVPQGVAPAVDVFSTSGTCVASSNNTELSLGHLASGIYLVRVNGHTFRVVKR